MADLHARGTPSHRFPPAPRSVAEARRFVRDVLGDVAPELMDTAQLLVSELVTNAVRTPARSPKSPSAPPGARSICG
ncbi:hypothetical protein GCM10010297_16120 [Streptomyces malachitofuscus]|nr:hypothetical protein GCM10010297_16120 [Streptomyces malachitofuscus]